MEQRAPQLPDAVLMDVLRSRRVHASRSHGVRSPPFRFTLDWGRGDPGNFLSTGTAPPASSRAAPGSAAVGEVSEWMDGEAPTVGAALMMDPFPPSWLGL